MSKPYVSEFTSFIRHYLEDHPEVVEDQRRKWAFFWQRKPEVRNPEKTKDDLAPDDSYGYAASAWHADKPDANQPPKAAKTG